MSRSSKLLGLVLLLGWTGPVGAQGSVWKLAPRAGVFVPTTALGDVPISSQIPTAVNADPRRGARLSSGMSVGLSILREIREDGTALRFDLDYVPPVGVDVEGYPGNFPVQASMASVMVGFERSLFAQPGRVRPYMTAGAGFRTVSFQPWLSAGPQFPGGQVSLAARVGGGAVMNISVLSIGAELTDQMSTFSFDGGGRRMLNDLHALVSVRVGVF